VVGADPQNLRVQLLLGFLLPGGELQGSAWGEVKDIKEQDDVVLALKVLETHLLPLAGRKAKIWSWTADLGSGPSTAREREREQPGG